MSGTTNFTGSWIRFGARAIVFLLALAVLLLPAYLALLDKPRAYPTQAMPDPPPGGRSYEWGRVEERLVFQTLSQPPRSEYLVAAETAAGPIKTHFGDAIPAIEEAEVLPKVHRTRRWGWDVVDLSSHGFGPKRYVWRLRIRYEIHLGYFLLLPAGLGLIVLIVPPLRRAAWWWATLPWRVAGRSRPGFPVVAAGRRADAP